MWKWKTVVSAYPSGKQVYLILCKYIGMLFTGLCGLAMISPYHNTSNNSRHWCQTANSLAELNFFRNHFEFYSRIQF